MWTQRQRKQQFGPKPPRVQRPPQPRKVFKKLSKEEHDAFTERYRQDKLALFRVLWVAPWCDEDQEDWYRERLKTRAEELKAMSLAQIRKLPDYKEYASMYRPRELKKSN